jgi:hypothetical protein
MTRIDLSRRTFVIALGGGATAAIGWTVGRFGGPLVVPCALGQVNNEDCCQRYVAYEGWMVTQADKLRLTATKHSKRT